MSTEREAPPLKIYDALVEEYEERYRPRHARVEQPSLMLGVFHGTGHTGIDAATIMVVAFLTVVLIGLLAVILSWWF